MTLAGISALINGTTSTILGTLVYLHNNRNPKNITYGLFCLSLAVWSYFYAAWQLTDESRSLAIFFCRGLMAGAIFIPVFSLHHVMTFLEWKAPLRRNRLLLWAYSGTVLFFLANFTSLIVKDVKPVPGYPFWPQPGILFHFFLASFFTIVGYFIYLLYRAYRESSGIRRNQVAYVLAGFVIGFAGGSTNFPLWYGIPLQPYGNILVSVYLGLIAYSIVRYRLMDIQVVVTKTTTYLLLFSGVGVLVGLTLFASGRVMNLRPYSYPPLVTAAIYFFAGLFVLAKNSSSILNRVFSTLWFSVSVWLFGTAMQYSVQDEHVAVFWSKVGFAGVIFIPVLFYHLASVFMVQPRKRVNQANYLAGVVFLALLLGTDRFLDGVYRYEWGYYSKSGIGMPVFLVFFLVTYGRGLHLLYSGWKRSERVSTDEANRRAYVFLGMSIAGLGATDFLPTFGWDYYPLGFIPVGGCLAMIMYAILRHQLMDIRVVIRRGVIYGLSLIGIYSVILVLGRVFWGGFSFIGSGVMLFLFLAFAGLLYKTVLHLEEAVAKTFFRRQYRAYGTLEEFSRAVVTILNFDHLTSRIVQTLVQTLGPHHAILYLYDPQRLLYRGYARYPESSPPATLESTFDGAHFFPRWLKAQGRIVIREELQTEMKNHETRAAADELGLMEAEACIPLINQDRLIGFCNLGQKKNREMYTNEDLKFLSTLAQQAAIALDNARLYEDVKRSRFLMMRTDRLKSLETMAGGFAHEIRNPLTSIKTFVELAVDRRDDPEFMSEFSKIAREDVLRIERLIREMLDYARQKDRQISNEDVNEVVASSSYFMRIEADKHQIRFENALATDLPRVSMDRQQIRQVFLNLYLNAIDAIGRKPGAITTRTQKFSKDNKDWVQISVSDTGYGISPEHLAHIFDPFFTTKHESTEREGTGLGLSIVHQIIEDHGGFITVESAPTQGATFMVHLPVVSPVEVEIAR